MWLIGREEPLRFALPGEDALDIQRKLVAAFEDVFGQEVPVREAPPRPGDAVGAFANADKAADLLDWRTELSLGRIRLPHELARRRSVRGQKPRRLLVAALARDDVVWVGRIVLPVQQHPQPLPP